MTLFKRDFDDGKYTVSFANGQLVALLHGEPWQNLTGNKLVLAMLAEVDFLDSQVAELHRSIEEIRTIQYSLAASNLKKIDILKAIQARADMSEEMKDMIETVIRFSAS